jgi:hypothetical protein
MAINVINRSGPLSFKSETNNTENLSINGLLSNFYNPGSSNFSLSQSYYQIENRLGNSNTDTKTISITKPIGTGFINKDNRRPIKFSEFYGASYFSSSFNVAASTGVATIKIYSPSVIQNNNFLTNTIQDKVYQYTLYSKSDVTTPIVDSGWNKVFSYAKAGDNVESFYNLIDTKAYKLVAKDCLSNAFTSSLFIGTCASSVTDNTTYSYTMNAPDLSLASSLLLQKINSDKSTNGYSNTKLTDISNILNNLNNLLQNPNISTFKSENQLLPTITYRDNLGYNRTLSFDGLICQKSNVPDGPLGYFYTGLVTATSVGGSNPTFQYSFENTSTFGQITMYILGTQDSAGSSCTSPPSQIGNFPINISFSGPRCGQQDCGDGFTQPVCNPTSTTQIRHSASFFITNNNNDAMQATISPTWTKLNGSALDSLLTPVVFSPNGIFEISSNSSKKISIGFGLSSYSNVSQPTSFTAKGSVSLNLPIGYNPQSQTCEIIANFDKNSCVVSVVQPPVVTPVTSNIGCVNYNSLSLENWTTIKNKVLQLITNGTGTTADKTFGKAVINSLPGSGCNLPTSYTQDGYVINLTWTLDSAGEQTYVCTVGTSGQFSGTYTVNASNSTLGTANFYILFLRKNNNNNDAESYINICQRGGVSSVGGGCPAAWQLMETLEHGFITAREIKVGMHLRDVENDKWNLVTVAFINRAPIYRTIIDNNIYDVDSSHKWYVGNGVWKTVTDIKSGNELISTDGKKLIVNDCYLLFEEEEYMHLNCENQRFVMGKNVIGHNFPVRKF